EKNPRILLTFRNRSKAALEQELGNFSDIPTDDLEKFFLARVKKYFNDADKNIDIEQFSFAKNVSDFFTKINSHDALIINSSDGFSPFACNYRYKSPVLDVQNVNILFEKSEVEVQGYRVALVEDDISFIKDDFFSLDYLYADIYKNENLKNDVRLPSVRYPLAEINPSYYVGYKDTSDIFLSFNTYNSVSRFEIGQNVSASSIVVYKNGVVDRNARYDESSGCVTLSSEVKDTDHIYITWYEDSQTFLEGSISSAIAFVYDFLPNLSLDLSFLSNWALGTKNKYASANSAKNGYVSFTSGINYEQSGFSLFNASMISLENQNVTGLYRIIDVESPSEQSVYLSQKSVHSLPKNFSPVLTNRDGGIKQELKEVDNKTKNVIAYQKEQNVSGYTFTLEWNFSNIDEFVGASIIINNGAELLNAKTFSIGIKSEEDLSSDIEIYLQLGVDSSEDFKSINESYGKIPTWKISALNSSAPLSQDVHKAFYLNRESADSNGWQVVSVALSDYDRSRMIKYNDARIIVLNKMDSSNSGKIILGPYEIGNENIITRSSKEISVSISTTEEMSSNIKQFSSSTNYAQNIRWQNNATSVQEYDKRKIYIAKYFDQVDISSYK
ncbi:MAG: hypothetical protein IJR49_04380, partial [Treponema sp.]|nr:hypothetical protein [Treponema sp.]